jgi:hypothetical protein
LIKVPTRVGWRVLEQPLDVNFHLPSLLPPARIECRKRTDLKWEPQSQTASLGQQPAVQTASLGQQPAVQTASLGQQPGGSFVIWTSQ